MAYILAGVTGTKLNALASNGTALGTFEDEDTVYGFTVGAGLEYKINKSWHARVQYRYSKYSDADFKYNYTPTNEILKGKFEYNTHSVMAGVSYHF